MLSSLLVLALAQQPPCLSSFQRVEPLGPTGPGYSYAFVAVDGDLAVAAGRPPGSSPVTPRLDFFERDPASGRWAATQSLALPPLFGGVRALDLEGSRAVVQLRSGAREALKLFERSAATGAWADVGAQTIPFPVRSFALSGDRVALGVDFPERIEIWRCFTSGACTLEDTIPPPEPFAVNFTTEFALDGDRLISNAPGVFDVYRRTASGAWPLEVSTRPFLPAGFVLNWWFEPPRSAGGRLIHAVNELSSGDYLSGVGFWRLSSGPAPTRVAYDGFLADDTIPGRILETDCAVLERGTALLSVGETACAATQGVTRQLGVVAAGPADVPTYLGTICSLAAGTTTTQRRAFDYDGRSIAITAVGEPGPGTCSVHFARLLGADLDGDANCVEDEQQIAADPSLDRNGNGRLDALEVRGREECIPGPNTSGTVARLRIVGNDLVPADDLFARIDGLPPATSGVLVVALSPAPAPPAGPFGLCIGGGASGRFGRYAAVQADAGGTAFVPVPATALPVAGGPVAGLPSERWGWQLIYRDGAGASASSAVRVRLF
ncbi:MAG: hypothetical protein AAGA20_11335 [Planctomycetota bacterium]